MDRFDSYIATLFTIYGYSFDEVAIYAWRACLEGQELQWVELGAKRFLKERIQKSVPLPAELLNYIRLEKEELAQHMQVSLGGRYNMLDDAEQTKIREEAKISFFKNKNGGNDYGRIIS